MIDIPKEVYDILSAKPYLKDYMLDIESVTPERVTTTESEYHFLRVKLKSGRSESIYHREDGPAMVTRQVKNWMRYGKRHREDGPAVEYNDGTKLWFQNDVLHREDGPAIESPPEKKDEYTASWYLNGEAYEEDDLKIKLLKRKYKIDN